VEDVSAATCIAVTESSRIAEARRIAKHLAAMQSFDETRAEEAAIVVTEAATNLVKHARGGQILMQAGNHSLEILSVDHGPGMRDVESSARDGHSSAGSPGIGMGAMRRLSAVFDVYSTPGKGTVVASTIRSRAWVSRSNGIEIAGISVAKPGETACGDDWTAADGPDGVVILVADGLGHGIQAAQASFTATSALSSLAAQPPAGILEELHIALRPTRGAAAAVARLDLHKKQVLFSGIGNVAGVIDDGGTPRHAVSMNGIVGHEAHPVREFSYPWNSGSILVLLSDGLGTRWDFSAYPGLRRRTPLLIAGVLYRDLLRGADDATIVVAKEKESR
jgi:anti-sigma regulatory factor (Ser/Thr protein kinase)